MQISPLALACVVLMTAASTGVASAQDDLMIRAREAADAGRLVEARDLLVQLMDTEPSPEAAANLAMVRRGLGELLESQRLLERLVAGELGELDPQRQEQATQLLREVRSEVATLTVVVHGTSGPVPIRLDGRLVGEASEAQRLTIACDPGRHLVRAVANGRTLEEDVELGIGGASTVELGFEVPTPEAVANDPINHEIVAPHTQPNNGVAIGVAIGAALVVIIVVVAVLAIVVPNDLPPQPDGYLGTSRL